MSYLQRNIKCSFPYQEKFLISLYFKVETEVCNNKSYIKVYTFYRYCKVYMRYMF